MAKKIKNEYTSKQFGDAGEMLVAGELTLAGVPALKVPDNWPDYDIVAQTKEGIQRISVKTRTYKKLGGRLDYDCKDKFDWLAILLLECPKGKGYERRFYLVPRYIADQEAMNNREGTKTESKRRFRIESIDKKFSAYRNNFSLSVTV